MGRIVYAQRSETAESYDTALISRLESAGHTVQVETGSLGSVNWAPVQLLIVGALGTLNEGHPDGANLNGYDVHIMSMCRNTSRISLGMSTGSTSSVVSAFTRVDNDDPRAIFESVTGTSQTSHALLSLVSGTNLIYHHGTVGRAGIAERFRDNYSRVHWGYHRLDTAGDDMLSLFDQFLPQPYAVSISGIDADDELSGEVQYVPDGGFTAEMSAEEYDDNLLFEALFFPRTFLTINFAEESDYGLFQTEHRWFDVAGGGAADILWRCEIVAEGFDPITVPMSSWQGTQQLGRSSYLQAVIPSASALYEDIVARSSGELVIYRRARFLGSGIENELEIARSPVQTIRFDRGPRRATVTISGYRSLSEGGTGESTLKDIRSISVSNGIRVRCGIDWTLRPGDMAVMDGQSFEATYINYYVTVSDAYMDVGERPL